MDLLSLMVGGLVARPGAGSDAGALRAAVAVLRARCSNLRHWCRLLLDDPNAPPVLDTQTTAELRATPPAVEQPDADELIRRVSSGGDVPPGHPLAPATADVNQLRLALTALTAEHERLRQALFALFDAAHPGDGLTDEAFFAQQLTGPLRPAAEVLSEIEREFEGVP